MEAQPDAFPLYATVQTWYQGLQRHGPLDATGWQERLTTLSAFCAYLGESPDRIIASCWRHTPEGKAIRTTARQYYAVQIAAFQQHLGGTQREQIHRGNMVRSFLIQNGIMLQVGWQYRPRSSTT
jgi:hypothetical protein